MLKKSIALLTLFFSVSASAALVDHGSYVTDTVAKIDYLKLSNTAGYSYSQIIYSDELGFLEAGWSLSSQNDLYILDSADEQARTLISDTNIVVVITNNDLVDVDQLANSLAAGHVPVDLWTSRGYEADQWGNTSVDAVGIDSPVAPYQPLAVSLSRSSEVPVPSAVWLFGSALVGLTGIKRKN